VDGITLYMQPVQDLTVEDRVSRTQYQYTLEDPDQNELNLWTKRCFVNKAEEACRSCAMWPPTSRRAGWPPSLVIDRVTASRMGITPQMIDETLYDAFGQRQISTLYTQLNQYHVILETIAGLSAGSPSCNDIYVRSALTSSATFESARARRCHRRRIRRAAVALRRSARQRVGNASDHGTFEQLEPPGVGALWDNVDDRIGDAAGGTRR
jgi:multidrug efflux pump